MSIFKRASGTLACVTALVLAVSTLLPVTASGAAASRVGTWYLYGSNMPWFNWTQDFGGGSSGGGVSGNVSNVDSKLQAAQAAGMHMIRWWVFEGGSPQIQRDSSGTPTGLNPNVYTDMDVAVAEAAKYDISYDFVLFGSTNDDATSHQWWEDSAKRAALVKVLTPLFKRYATNPRVHTWELVNEPEWQSRNGQTTVAGMLATGDALANAIHQNSSALVTVGNAQIQDMQTWVGHPIDYYSPHYYDNFGTDSNDPFINKANSPDGKPVVIGEFPASTGLNPDALTRWNDLYANGYAGAWNWSWNPDATGDHLGTDVNAATTFSRGKSDLGPRGAAAPPTSTPTPRATSTPTPKGTSTPTARPTSSPTPKATSTPVSAPTWTLRGSTSATSVRRAASIKLTARVTANSNAKALVDLEVYDPAWNQVFQQSWDNQSFTANTARSFSATWTVPSGAATGTYTVMVGTFGPGWNGVDSFNNNAATFSVR
jgi:hypothetical protein